MWLIKFLTENSAVSWLSGIWFLKPYGASHPSHGFNNLFLFCTHKINYYSLQDKNGIKKQNEVALNRYAYAHTHTTYVDRRPDMNTMDECTTIIHRVLHVCCEWDIVIIAMGDESDDHLWIAAAWKWFNLLFGYSRNVWHQHFVHEWAEAQFEIRRDISHGVRQHIAQFR